MRGKKLGAVRLLLLSTILLTLAAGCMAPAQDPIASRMVFVSHTRCEPAATCHIVDVHLFNGDKRNLENRRNLWEGVGSDGAAREADSAAGPALLPPGAESDMRVVFNMTAEAGLVTVRYHATWMNGVLSVAVPAS